MTKYGKGRKSLPCKVCDETVENVGYEATAVTCFKCVSDQLRGFPMIEDEKDWDSTIQDGLDQIEEDER